MLGIVSWLIQNKIFNDTKKNLMKAKLVKVLFQDKRQDKTVNVSEKCIIVFITLQSKLETQNMNASSGNRNTTNQLGGVPTM